MPNLKDKNHMYVSLKVSPIIREFIVSSNKSNVIIPGKHDCLWLLIKQNLVIDDKPIHIPDKEEEKEIIYIEILDCRSSKTLTLQPNQNKTIKKKGFISKELNEVYINTLFRHSLSEKGERVIRNFLYRQFKSTFHTFVMASKMANPTMSYLSIISHFIEVFEIDEIAINKSMLIKSWQRFLKSSYMNSKEKAFIDYGEKYCPLLV